MDIVTRIKYYMNSQNIGSSQFADACDIPRPTLSQILNGRNKKISDEIIRKIHQAYPDLSMLWLMFGEGEMLVGGNNGFSGAQNGGIIDFGTIQSSDNDTNNADAANSERFSQKYPEKDEIDSGLFDPVIAMSGGSKGEHAERQDRPDVANNSAKVVGTSVISVSPDSSKRIVNIMVFYSDNSFESFIPAEVQ